MTGTMFFNMLLNIGLLVLLATLLTNMASVRKLFRGESSTIIQKMALAVIFGATRASCRPTQGQRPAGPSSIPASSAS